MPGTHETHDSETNHLLRKSLKETRLFATCLAIFLAITQAIAYGERATNKERTEAREKAVAQFLQWSDNARKVDDDWKRQMLSRITTLEEKIKDQAKEPNK